MIGRCSRRIAGECTHRTAPVAQRRRCSLPPLPPLHPLHPRRGFAKAAAKGKEVEKAPKPKTPAAPTVRAVTKPPHPSSRPLPPTVIATPTPRASSPLLTSLTPPPTYSDTDPVFSLPDPHNLHTPSTLSFIASKYRWINWTRLSDHLHRTDIHFFDNDVKYVDQDFDVKPDTEELKKVAALDEMEYAAEEEADRLFQLLPFSAFIDQGSHTRVTRFGKVRSKWVLIIAGDQCGTASFGIGKGEDTAEAVDRAERDLKNNVTFLPLIESRTIMYETIGQFGVCKIHMKPLPRGAGMVAGVVPRLVFDAFGIRDISAKVIGRRLPKHQVFAIWEGLSQQKSMRELSLARGVKLHRMFERGVEQPRAPPRWVMDERAEEIGKKLKEAAVALEDIPEEEQYKVDDEIARMDEEEAEADTVEGKRIAFMSDEEKQDLLDRGVKGKDGRKLDADDVMDGDEAVQLEEEKNHWGPWATPGNYVPVLPPAMPYIPSPAPAEPVQLSKGRRIRNKKE